MFPNSEILSFIQQHSDSQTIPANTWLFRQGEPLRDIFLLEKGLVKMTRLEANGREVIAGLRFAGSLVGAASVMAGNPALMTAITSIECEVARLSAKDFLKLEQMNAKFSHDLLVFISQQNGEQAIHHGKQKAFPSRMRLAQLLLWLMRHFGVERNGDMRLASPLSKQEMAAWVGIEPPSLSAILREMKREGLIAEVKGWIILRDFQRLTYEAETGERSSVSLCSSKKAEI